MSWTAFAVGVVVVACTWMCLVATFVLPRGRSVFQRLSNGIFWGIHRVAAFSTHVFSSYRKKDGVLALVGPLALVIQLAVFMAMFGLGYALVLYPWAHTFGLAVREAVSSLLTVGIERAAGPTNDAVILAAAYTGAVTIALQIGYLPALYQAFARREALVALMESRAGVPAWGPEVLMRHQLVHSVDALDGFYGDWENWSADVAESHTTHPVLLVFRSPVPGYSWLLSLLAVLDATALHVALAPSTAPSEARMCLRMGFTALRRLARTLGWHPNVDPLPDDPIELTYDDFAAAVAQLEKIGFVAERTALEAWPHFRGWRVNYEATAYRLADLLVTPNVPWSGARRHLPSDLMLPERPPHRAPDGKTFDARQFRPER